MEECAAVSTCQESTPRKTPPTAESSDTSVGSGSACSSARRSERRGIRRALAAEAEDVLEVLEELAGGVELVPAPPPSRD